jgi:uncharacterized protein with PQ loop repeat
MTVLTLIFQLLNVSLFGDLVGLVSMTIEATLGLPQMYSNWSTKSVKGLSYTMIGMWFLGDFSKTLYFIFEVLSANSGAALPIRDVRGGAANCGRRDYSADCAVRQGGLCGRVGCVSDLIMDSYPMGVSISCVGRDGSCLWSILR